MDKKKRLNETKLYFEYITNYEKHLILKETEYILKEAEERLMEGPGEAIVQNIVKAAGFLAKLPGRAASKIAPNAERNLAALEADLTRETDPVKKAGIAKQMENIKSVQNAAGASKEKVEQAATWLIQNMNRLAATGGLIGISAIAHKVPYLKVAIEKFPELEQKLAASQGGKDFLRAVRGEITPGELASQHANLVASGQIQHNAPPQGTLRKYAPAAAATAAAAAGGALAYKALKDKDNE